MLFKFINPSKKPAGTVEEDGIRNSAPGFNSNIAWESLRPLITQAEILFLKPELGSFLATLQTLYAAYPTTPLSAENEAIIRKLQLALGPYVELLAMESGLVITGEAGPRETGDVKGTSAAPRQWAYNKKLAALKETAYLLLDDALLYLFENAADYPAWSAGAIYTKGKSNFFFSLESLREYIPTNITGVAWRRLAPALLDAERRYIRPVLGDAFMAELKDAIADNTLTAAQTEVVEEIRRALSRWAIREALPHFGLVVGPDGAVTIQTADGVTTAARNGDAIGQLWTSLTEWGEYYLTGLRTLLEKKRATFTTWDTAFPATAGKTPYTGLITHHPDTDDQLSIVPFV